MKLPPRVHLAQTFCVASQMQVQLASDIHHQSLVELLLELHGYYNEKSSVSEDLARAYLVDTLLAPDSPLQLVVASRGGGIVLGFAAISYTYSLVDLAPDRRRQCWLKELYVRSAERGAGVGRALMVWIARHALAHGCSRIDWPVKASNARGMAFYERLGAARVDDRLSYRLMEPYLGHLAAEKII
ncbi:MAG TPA: GNAT family N-acetyltransferase [Chitinolyticbacter sp.]|nr:GNAT family N-acetyltransferase [Chitinolyticbacter sp.]